MSASSRAIWTRRHRASSLVRRLLLLAKPVREKRACVKSGLRLGIAFLRCNRPGTAGGTGAGSTILPGALQMTATSGIVIGPIRRESGNRARGETRLPTATLAWRRRPLLLWEIEALPQAKRPTIGVPQPPLWVDEQAQRRAMDRLGLQRPRLEVQPGRAAERVKGGRPKLRRHAVDQPPRPSVQRIGQSIMKLERAGKHGPLVATSPPKQHHGPTACTVQKRRSMLTGIGDK